jgi:hypothetical protein
MTKKIITEEEPLGYGDNPYTWPTVSMMYSDNDAYIARESIYSEGEWEQAIAAARADGFLGEIVQAHTDEYPDGNHVTNFTINDKPLLKQTLIGHRSFSSMTSWIRCGKAWQLERDLKVPSQPAWWFVGGTSFHLAVERYLKATLSQNESEVEND